LAESRGLREITGTQLVELRAEVRAARRSTVTTATTRAVAPASTPAPAVVIRKLRLQIARLQDENTRLKVAAITLVKQ